MKTHSTLSPAITNRQLTIAGPKLNPSCTTTTAEPPAPPLLELPPPAVSLLSVPDAVLEHDMLTFLLPDEAALGVGRTHRDCVAPVSGRICRGKIRVPKDCSSINMALKEVSFLIRHKTPHAIPEILVGPGKHILKGGLLTISDSGVIIRGTTRISSLAVHRPQIIGRIRVECGAKDVLLDSLSISNPFGAGIWITGKGTQVMLKNSKVSGCRGDGIYARQGASCELVSCDVEKNASTGIAVWDDKTAFKIFDTTVAKNQGDGVKVFPGAAVHMMGSRVRRNSGHGLVTSDECSSINIFSSSVVDNTRGQMQGQVIVRRERSATA